MPKLERKRKSTSSKNINAKLTSYHRKTKINPYGQLILTENEYERARNRYSEGLKKLGKSKIKKKSNQSFATDDKAKGLILTQSEKKAGIKRYNKWKRQTIKSQ